MYKIQWNHHTEEEATWETENFLQRNFPNFLRTNSGIKPFHSFSSCNLGARFPLGGEGCDTLGVCTVELHSFYAPYAYFT